MFKKLWNMFQVSSKTPIDTEGYITEKDRATARGEPYVKVLNVDFEKENPGNGYFELDWNEPFVKQLIQAGYTGNSQEEIVDQWFTELCRNISAQEM